MGVTAPYMKLVLEWIALLNLLEEHDGNDNGWSTRLRVACRGQIKRRIILQHKQTKEYKALSPEQKKLPEAFPSDAELDRRAKRIEEEMGMPSDESDDHPFARSPVRDI